MGSICAHRIRLRFNSSLLADARQPNACEGVEVEGPHMLELFTATPRRNHHDISTPSIGSDGWLILCGNGFCSNNRAGGKSQCGSEYAGRRGSAGRSDSARCGSTSS